MRGSRHEVFWSSVGASVIVALLVAGCTTSDELVDPATELRLEAFTETSLGGTVGAQVTPAPTVRVTALAGGPAPGIEIRFAVSGGGTVAIASVRTDRDGMATTGTWTLGPATGAQTVTARSAGLADVVFTAKAEPGPAAAITPVTGNYQKGLTGAALANPLRARVADRFGNSVPLAPVTFVVLSGNGTLDGSAVLTDALGIAMSGVWTLGGAPGAQQVKAQAGDLGAAFTAFAYDPVTLPAARLAFVRDDQIYLVNADGTGLAQLTNTGGDASNRDPAWSRDGQRLAFARGNPDGSSWDIYVMNADGSNVVQLTSGGYNVEPAWGPDGRTIAFTSLLPGSAGVSVIDVDTDGSQGSRILLDRPGWDAQPAWSPDGRTITFTSDWRAYDFVYDLYAMNADGSDVRPLLEGPFFWVDGLTFFFQSAWSPDGQKIAVVICGYAWDNCYPNSAIAVANADGSGLKVIAQAGSYARPTWSPDGRWIAFGSSGCRTCQSSIWVVHVDGGTEGLVVDNGHSPTWRP